MARRLLKTKLFCLLTCMQVTVAPTTAQSLLHRIGSALTTQYYNTDDIDTAYVSRPETKWTVRVQGNVSGTKIRSEGMENDQHFKAELEANKKATLSVGVSYLGYSLSVSVNPAKLMGKYHDNEVYFKSYGKRFGFDLTYQDAKNFTGWHDHEGKERIYLHEDILEVKTLNANAYYAFNHRRFSYPAAFSQDYIQRHSAGSFLLALSAQGQQATLDWEQQMKLKMTNIGIGAGYGYNYVPSQRWLLHITALPTFVVYNKTSMTFGDKRVPLHYHFPQVIITGRGAVVYQTPRTFYGLFMVFNFTNVGNEKSLAIHNIKWNISTFFGLRL